MTSDLTFVTGANINYYTVYHRGYDSIRFDTDVFLKLRKQYFENGGKLRDKVVIDSNGETYKFVFTMEPDHALKWKKYSSVMQLERVVQDSDGCYHIETKANDGSLIKNTYFTTSHKWLKTEYFAQGNATTPKVTLIPSIIDNTSVILKYETDLSKAPVILYPCKTPANKSILKAIVKQVGKPEVSAQTSSGYIYFGTTDECAAWTNVLNSLTATDRQAIPAMKQVEDDAPATPNKPETPRKNGFVVDTESFASYDNNASSSIDIDISDMPSINEPATTEQTFVENSPINEPVAEANAFDGAALISQTIPEPVVLEPTIDNNVYDDKTENINVSQMLADTSPAITDEPPTVPIENLIPQPDQINTSELYGNSLDYSNRQTSQLPIVDKIIPVSDTENYYYYGNLRNGMRYGQGRTAMQDGRTAYEGRYADDKRDGFGVYYYKTGRICYVGNWIQNRRNGMGIAFRPSDESVYIGKWEDDMPVGMGAKFDQSGNLLFAGKWENGARNGAGISYNSEDGSLFISRWENDSPTNYGTRFDKNGNLEYIGYWENGQRHGTGIQYGENGFVIYSGDWLNDKYHGTGRLTLENGNTIDGSFIDGRISGAAIETDTNGVQVYRGEWSNNKYNGLGRKYLKNGCWYEGRFIDGSPVGILSGYDKNGSLIYEGEWKNDCYHGKGVCYHDGVKIYEGDFEQGTRHGIGREYENNVCIYIGGFSGDKRNGFGMSYKNGKSQYMGKWKDNLYCGSGVLYDAGIPVYAGQFRDGMLNGRINEIHEGKVIRESIFVNNSCTYMREYSNDGAYLSYEGNVKNGIREGMGCSFNIYGEKTFEGIFKDNKPFKSMKISLKELEPLNYYEQLKDTDYEKFRTGLDYVIELNIGGGIYSGQTIAGRPNGLGTILYTDHRYTGHFEGGSACGEGVLYKGDGDEIKGVFSPTPGEDTEEIVFDYDVTYYVQSVDTTLEEDSKLDADDQSDEQNEL
ncbi:MAG: hypothetical protein ACI4II_03735 [Acutalibacteraceae bacterium]